MKASDFSGHKEVEEHEQPSLIQQATTSLEMETVENYTEISSLSDENKEIYVRDHSSIDIEKNDEILPKEVKDSIIANDPRYLRKLYKKVDERLVSSLWIIYFFAFSAKSIISVSFTMNYLTGDSLQQRLSLTSSDISRGISLFYIGYVIFELPSNMIITYVSPRFWLSETLITIGFVSLFYSCVKNTIGFFTIRFLLGVMESGLWPGMAYYITLYYQPHMIAKRLLFYFTAAQISSITIGYVSAAFQKLNGIGNLEGYKWMFLTYGTVTILIGIISMWLLPPTFTEKLVTEDELKSSSWIVRMYKKFKKSTEIGFLTPYEKHVLMSNMSLKDPWTYRDLLMIFVNPKIWLLIVMYFGGIGVGISVQNYGSLIIQSIDSAMSGFRISLLYGTIWISNLVGVLIIIPLSHYYHSYVIILITCYIIITIGMLILTYSLNKWIQYFGILFTAFGMGPTVPVCMAWCTNIFSSQANINVAASTALLSGLGNLGSVFTTYTLYKGMPGNDPYKKSNLIICGMMCMSMLACLGEKMLLSYSKKKKAKALSSNDTNQIVIQP